VALTLDEVGAAQVGTQPRRQFERWRRTVRLYTLDHRQRSGRPPADTDLQPLLPQITSSEREFARFLEDSDDVFAFAKLPPTSSCPFQSNTPITHETSPTS